VAKALQGEFMPYELVENIDRTTLEKLLTRFRDAVKRDSDRGLADEIERQVLDSKYPRLTLPTLKKLARWCKTAGGLYEEGMLIAQEISEILFGKILDRSLLGT
jgi:hypothetical protein